MKKLNLIVMTALLFGLLQACGGSKDSKAKADSLNAVKDTSTKPLLQPDTAKAAVTPHIVVNTHDAKFAVDAMAGGITEVELGKLAQEKSANSQIKEFGAMMVADHNKANQELEALGQKLRIALPNAIDKDGQKIKDELSKKTGSEFDKAYVKDMIADHKEDIKVFEDAEKNCKDSDLQPFAARTIITLRKHLDAIQKINDSMK